MTAPRIVIRFVLAENQGSGTFIPAGCASVEEAFERLRTFYGARLLAAVTTAGAQWGQP
jgi:hypothetical protein